MYGEAVRTQLPAQQAARAELMCTDKVETDQADCAVLGRPP